MQRIRRAEIGWSGGGFQLHTTARSQIEQADIVREWYRCSMKDLLPVVLLILLCLSERYPVTRYGIVMYLTISKSGCFQYSISCICLVFTLEDQDQRMFTNYRTLLPARSKWSPCKDRIRPCGQPNRPSSKSPHSMTCVNLTADMAETGIASPAAGHLDGN